MTSDVYEFHPILYHYFIQKELGLEKSLFDSLDHVNS